MSSQGILQADGTRCYSGPECKRHGAYNTAVMNSIQDYLTQSAGTSEAFIKSILKSHDREKDFLRNNGITEAEWKELSTGESQFEAFDPYVSVYYDYDSYETPEWADDDDGYGRNREYSGLRVQKSSLVAEDIAKSLFRPKTPSAQNAAIAFVVARGLDKIDAYEVITTHGYYGEEAYVDLTEKSKQVIADWHYSFANAQDRSGGLDYARTNGVQTTGLTPAEAVLEVVKAKTGEVPNIVGGANLHSETRGSKIFKVDEKKLDKVEAVAPVKGEIAGVIYSENNNSAPVLLYGYEQYKHLQATTPTAQRKWLVIS